MIKKCDSSVSNNIANSDFNFFEADGKTFKFLGTIGGDQCYLSSYMGSTYARVCRPIVKRTLKSILNFDVARRTPMGAIEYFKETGEDYSYIPSRIAKLLQEERNFGFLPGRLPGGGFFLTTKKLEGEAIYWDSFEYALSTFGSRLENLASIPMSEIQAQYKAYGIDYIIYQYFNCVTLPEDGDLVVYEKKHEKIHSGIYHASKPNWNSPLGGTVESKWKPWPNPYIFQHDLFFLPEGDVALFYRVKSTVVTLSSSISLKSSFCEMYKMQEDGNWIYNSTQGNDNIRKELTKTFDTQELVSKFPQIQVVPHIKFYGLCYDYAFGKILRTYLSPSVSMALNNKEILEKYFSITKEPEEGDLVVYYFDSEGDIPIHYGVYISEGIVESKWGSTKEVLRHPLGWVPDRYERLAKCLTMNEGLTPAILLRLLQEHKSK